MQELSKFNLKINVISNGLEKYIWVLVSITGQVYWWLPISKFFIKANLGKHNLKCLNQELDNNVLDLVKQKRFYPYKYMTDL